ncbi:MULTISPECIES: hypothetical protein [unclassified Streptomyces]|uniref:Uncharacterized protein n=1 Tax=Streptomyces sp. NBC_00180 TaxID=2903632 RepID=A0AAU1I0H4_9ACTN|nr:hypothetical protein OG331_31490 [Streptomyces sp. NBC_01017]
MRRASLPDIDIDVESARRPNPPDFLRFRQHDIEEWVQWKTELGSPKEHTNPIRLASLGDLE